ncbi:MAG: hypothetical protein ACE368_17845 [Paracoccaceae bacterium]
MQGVFERVLTFFSTMATPGDRPLDTAHIEDQVNTLAPKGYRVTEPFGG